MAISGINMLSQTQSIMQAQQQQDDDSAFASILEKTVDLEKTLTPEEEQELKEACQQVEEYMLSMIYKQMKSSIQTDENALIPKGDYEEMFESQYIDVQVSEMVKAGGIGLADAMYKQMTGQQTMHINLNA
ncbi:MAG: hypothetical protein ATN36_01265 [Epulopiscium sp. Nele67-Bin005]|nr:MAG: hypothetical protein ATN36_01265 [Epulopiscium sp. Nele67-Bin005]